MIKIEKQPAQKKKPKNKTTKQPNTKVCPAMQENEILTPWQHQESEFELYL